MHAFDKNYWEAHWSGANPGPLPAHPVLEREIAAIGPGTALEAGSGEGAEAMWLAARGWNVTAVDISGEAIRRARSQPASEARAVNWIEADLTTWEPENAYDLVTTFYAHPTIPQMAFYRRISRWVAPGGTLLIVGHDHVRGSHGQHPQNAVTGAELIRSEFSEPSWEIQTAEVRERFARGTTLADVIVRAHRLP